MVEGVCSGCLLGLALGRRPPSRRSEDGGPARASADLARATSRWPQRGRGAGSRGRLQPLAAGLAEPLVAMPVELLRQAARRLRVAAFGVGARPSRWASLLNNLVARPRAGTHFSHLALKNVVAAGMAAVSAAVGYPGPHPAARPGRLLKLSLAYEVVVALAISISDHLEPLVADVPFGDVSWLCVWIVIFPLVVPAPPRWALGASLAAASTWPLGLLRRGSPRDARPSARARGGPQLPRGLRRRRPRPLRHLPSCVGSRSWAATSSRRSWTTGAWGRSGGPATICSPARWR